VLGLLLGLLLDDRLAFITNKQYNDDSCRFIVFSSTKLRVPPNIVNESHNDEKPVSWYLGYEKRASVERFKKLKMVRSLIIVNLQIQTSVYWLILVYFGAKADIRTAA